jgi:Leucine-rich repeat (LRR) protein
LKRNSLLEDLNDDFTSIGMHDLWIEFAVAETRSQDSRDHHCWMYQVDGKKALRRRTGRWRESVERMCFLNDGWTVLKELNLYDFPNVEVLKLEAVITIQDSTLDLDLTGLKQLKSLELNVSLSKIARARARVTGLCSLTNLVFLRWYTYRFSPCLKDIRRLTNLQVLWLCDCRATRVLDLTYLEALRNVKISLFPNLTAVRGFSSRMARLQSLAIWGCRELVECAGLGEVWSLEVLCVRDSGRLEELPCLGRLTRLRELDISQSKSLRAVPGLSDLVALERLWAEKCFELVEVPDLVKLTRLQMLDIEHCPVQEVPGLDGLVALTTLYAFFGVLAKPVRSLSKLSTLKEVSIRGWSGPIWMSIQSLLVLEDLCLVECTGDESVVPDLRSLARLKVVFLFNCNCKDVTGLSNSVALENLVFQYCAKLERLPKLERLTKLTHLAIVGCISLQDSPSSLCSSLHSLDVDVPASLMRFATSSTGLRRLALWGNGCEDVLSIMPSRLETLQVHCCATMEAVDVGSFPRLQELTLKRCSGLQRVTCSRSLTHGLRELKVSGCRSLVELPDLSTFPQLERLRLKECRAVTRLSCSRPVVALRKIELFSCDSGLEIPSFSLFPKLKVFRRDESLTSDDDEDERSPEELDHDGFGYRTLVPGSALICRIRGFFRKMCF